MPVCIALRQSAASLTGPGTLTAGGSGRIATSFAASTGSCGNKGIFLHTRCDHTDRRPGFGRARWTVLTGFDQVSVLLAYTDQWTGVTSLPDLYTGGHGKSLAETRASEADSSHSGVSADS